MIEFLFSQFGGYLAAGVGALAALVGFYLKARSDGKKAAQSKQLKQNAKERETIEDVAREAGSMTEEEVDQELGKWEIK